MGVIKHAHSGDKSIKRQGSDDDYIEVRIVTFEGRKLAWHEICVEVSRVTSKSSVS